MQYMLNVKDLNTVKACYQATKLRNLEVLIKEPVCFYV